MGLDTKATDWEVAGLGGVAGGVGLAGGGFLFKFRSKSAGVEDLFLFGAFGFGAGIDFGKILKLLKSTKNLSKAKLLELGPKSEKILEYLSYASYSPEEFTAIKVTEPFSFNNLNHTPGKIIMATITPGVGYTWIYISGGFAEKPYFTNEPCNGWGAGAGLSGIYALGAWQKVNV